MSDPWFTALTLLGSATALLGGGFLWGHRRGAHERYELERTVRRQEVAVHVLQDRLVRNDRSSPPATDDDLAGTLRTVLAPMVHQRQLGHALAALQARNGLAGLPSLLDAIAEQSGLHTVVLSDDAGLPIAASRDVVDPELTAGMAARLAALADHAHSAEQSRPVALVVQDEAQQKTLLRLFFVGDSRYVLTATSRATQLQPDALDPVLAGLSRALDPRDLAA